MLNLIQSYSHLSKADQQGLQLLVLCVLALVAFLAFVAIENLTVIKSSAFTKSGREVQIEQSIFFGITAEGYGDRFSSMSQARQVIEHDT